MLEKKLRSSKILNAFYFSSHANDSKTSTLYSDGQIMKTEAKPWVLVVLVFFLFIFPPYLLSVVVEISLNNTGATAWAYMTANIHSD